jgi:RND family efflux transporter MFP subunit
MIGAEMPGTVTSVLVQAGAIVVKGQVLATLDDRIIRQGLQEVETQYELANQVYERQKNLWQQKIGSEIQYLQAKTGKEALEKRLATTREQLEMTRIKSPINGTVDQVMAKTGQAAAPGVPAFRIVNLGALKVVGEVAESYVSKIKTGNETVLVFPDLGTEVKTRLDHAGQAINRLNRTFNVEVHLDGSKGQYRPNMIAVLKIADYSAEKAFTVPVSAVQQSGEGSFVFVADEKGNARRRDIKTGMTYNGMTQVLEGLVEGDKVITTGYQGILEGDRIEF